MNPCNDCVSKNICGNPNITGCISYTKQEENFLPINCYVCNASGWIAGNNYRHPSKCTRCNGTGEINFYTMTNEDFLRTATTEQLAEFIRQQRDGWSDGWYSDCHRFEEIVEWLKEIHHDGSGSTEEER